MTGILQEQRQTSYYPYGVFQLAITGTMGNKKRGISLKFTTHMGHFDQKWGDNNILEFSPFHLSLFPITLHNKNAA